MKTLNKLDSCQVALIDLLDGQHNWYDIHANTGLSEERCIEIQNLYAESVDDYKEKHHIGD